MIVDPLSSRSSMAKNDDYEQTREVPQQAPPSYDAVVSCGNSSVTDGHGHFVLDSTGRAQDVKVPILPSSAPYTPAGSGPSTQQLPATVVYNYVHSQTGERIVSLLPPDHPQMVCLQHGHVKTEKFGILGILAAIIWFPFGIGLCLLDRKVYCRRCGQILNEGMC